MSVSFRRDQRRFIVLGAVIASVVVLFLISAQDSISVPKPTYSWIPRPSLPNTYDETSTGFKHGGGLDSSPATDTVGKPKLPSSSSPPVLLTHVTTTFEPSKVQTKIPQVRVSLDSPARRNAGTHGFSLFDNLYLKGGVFYIVTDHPKDFPDKEHILTGIIIEDEEGDADTDASQFLQFITADQAKKVLGDVATVVPGVSAFIADRPQFLAHFYHFWGEVILGAWKIYSALALSKDPTEIDRLAPIERWVMPFVDHSDGWRDRAGLNGPLMRLAFPQAAVGRSGLWKDWIKLGNTLVFERSLLISRRAAHKSPISSIFYKMLSSTEDVAAPVGYFEPLRKAVAKGLFNYIPTISDASGAPLVEPKFKASSQSGGAAAAKKGLKPIVTYISRQSTGRRLLTEDHEGLVAALKGLEVEGLCEVRIPVMEDLTLPEQMAEIASSTIMVGVHGNGLTHQIFMPPSLRSTVFEIQYPGDWANDYWMLARNMGHKHYMVNNDTLITYRPDKWHKGVNFGAEFHGPRIPVFGPAIADMIRTRLTQRAREVEP